MAAVDVIDVSGAKSGTVELSDAVFGVEPNVPLMHQVVTAQLAARRSGTQSTRTRAEVAGEHALGVVPARELTVRGAEEVAVGKMGRLDG